MFSVKVYETLDSTKNLSKKILSRMIEIMKQIDDSDSEFLENFFEMLDPNESLTIDQKNRALEELKNSSLKIVADSQTILEEFSDFEKTLIRGGDDEIEKLENCDFLKEVWFGDVFEKDHLDGLLALVEDLENQFKMANQRIFMDTCIKALTKSKQ